MGLKKGMYATFHWKVGYFPQILFLFIEKPDKIKINHSNTIMIEITNELKILKTFTAEEELVVKRSKSISELATRLLTFYLVVQICGQERFQEKEINLNYVKKLISLADLDNDSIVESETININNSETTIVDNYSIILDLLVDSNDILDIAICGFFNENYKDYYRIIDLLLKLGKKVNINNLEYFLKCFNFIESGFYYGLNQKCINYCFDNSNASKITYTICKLKNASELITLLISHFIFDNKGKYDNLLKLFIDDFCSADIREEILGKRIYKEIAGFSCPQYMGTEVLEEGKSAYIKNLCSKYSIHEKVCEFLKLEDTIKKASASIVQQYCTKRIIEVFKKDKPDTTQKAKDLLFLNNLFISFLEENCFELLTTEFSLEEQDYIKKEILHLFEESKTDKYFEKITKFALAKNNLKSYLEYLYNE